MLVLLLVSLFFSSQFPHLAFPYEDPRGTLCGVTTPYAANSTFSTNLHLALITLQNNTAATGFNSTTAGGNLTDSVTALALCRASLSPSDCQTCVDAATAGIRLACPNQTVAQVWYTLCMVRYSTVNFINKLDNSIGFMLYDVRDAPDQNAYDPKVKMLMQNLSYAAGVSDKRSAVGKTTLLGNLNIYGYVDCTRDINGGDCTTCLLDATDAIPSCCLGQWAGWIATPTCNIQFNMDPVHDDWINPPEINTELPSAPTPEADEGRSEGGTDGKGRSILVPDLAVAVAAVVVIVGVFVVVVMWRRKKEGVKRAEERGEIKMMRDGIGMRSFAYDLDVLVVATNNFSSENRLGGGGFGTVYRGKVASGEEIAVKKLKAGSMQGIEEFSNEVKLLLKIHHINLVQLLGCFIRSQDMMMLVYEYLPNKSLDYFLFDKSKSALLDWRKRLNIIMGVARGLQYLHEDSQLRIIHRDIKASNILLDQHMNPKISDFGLARLFNGEQSRLRTRRIVGTFGYMAPEYAVRGVVSTKADVFSFGVLILETISGRKNFDLQFDEERRQLLNFARRVEEEGRIMDLVDVTMGSYPGDDVLRSIRIGLLCCQENVQDRPTMSSALMMLRDASITVPLAGRLGYQDHNPTVNPSTFSNNSLTISLPAGR